MKYDMRNAKVVKEQQEVADMEKTLPKYRETIDGESIELTDKEWSKFDGIKYFYKDTGKQCFESDHKVLLELLEMGDIEPMKETNYVASETYKPEFNKTGWFEKSL